MRGSRQADFCIIGGARPSATIATPEPANHQSLRCSAIFDLAITPANIPSKPVTTKVSDDNTQV